MRFRCEFTVTILAAWLALANVLGMAQDPSKNEKKPAAVDARALLEQGRATGALPEGMVVRVAACLGELSEAAGAKQLPATMTESWEFASDQVHRVALDYREGEASYRRIESRPFDSKGICRDLLEGKAIEIQARQGKGPKLALAGSPYGRGSRCIEVVWKGETMLDLHETNGPTLDVYRESDARAFGALYETLAKQARVLFGSGAGEAK